MIHKSRIFTPKLPLTTSSYMIYQSSSSTRIRVEELTRLEVKGEIVIELVRLRKQPPWFSPFARSRWGVIEVRVQPPKYISYKCIYIIIYVAT